MAITKDRGRDRDLIGYLTYRNSLHSTHKGDKDKDKGLW